MVVTTTKNHQPKLSLPGAPPGVPWTLQTLNSQPVESTVSVWCGLGSSSDRWLRGWADLLLHGGEDVEGLPQGGSNYCAVLVIVVVQQLLHCLLLLPAQLRCLRVSCHDERVAKRQLAGLLAHCGLVVRI